jgi:hypothetical protein
MKIDVNGTNKFLFNLMKLDLDKRQFARPYFHDVMENMNRVAQLLFLHDSLKKSTEYSSNSATDDILRLSVVFVHSTLEEFLRRLAVELLPKADEKVLNSIPLITESGRAEKFSLGSLAKLKGKTIDEVITNSVESYYERSNFNNTVEISALFRDLGIDVSKVKHHFSEINNLMNRRHLIVHRADKVKQLKESSDALVTIKSEEVVKWLRVVTEFCADVIEEVFDKNLLT